MRLALATTHYAVLAFLLIVALAYGLGNPHVDPVPPRTVISDRATPVESLTHQLEQAYEMDQIQAGQR